MARRDLFLISFCYPILLRSESVFQHKPVLFEPETDAHYYTLLPAMISNNLKLFVRRHPEELLPWFKVLSLSFPCPDILLACPVCAVIIFFLSYFSRAVSASGSCMRSVRVVALVSLCHTAFVN